MDLGESGGSGDEDEETATGTLVGYHRGPARGLPTAVEAFAGRLNETEGAGPTALVTPGGDEVRLSVGAERVAVAPDGVRLVAPSAAFGEEGVVLEHSLLLTSIETVADYGGAWMGSASEDGAITPYDVFDLDEENHALVPVDEFIPDDMNEWIPDDDVHEWIPKRIEHVLVVTGERTFPGAFGVGLEKDGRLVEDGETIDAATTVLAGPADQFVPGGPIWNWEEVADSRPAPLGGATFGMGVFVGPADEAFPLGHWGLDESASLVEALQSEAGMKTVAEFVLGAHGDVVWHDPPIHPPPQIWGGDRKRDGERLAATLETDRGTEGVALHVVEVTLPVDGGEELSGIVVGGQVTPIGIVPAGWVGSPDTMADFAGEWSGWLDGGAELMDAAVGRLEGPDPDPSQDA